MGHRNPDQKFRDRSQPCWGAWAGMAVAHWKSRIVRSRLLPLHRVRHDVIDVTVDDFTRLAAGPEMHLGRGPRSTACLVTRHFRSCKSQPMPWMRQLPSRANLRWPGGLLRPGEKKDSPPGQEPLGVITSNGPSLESYTSAAKASGRTAETPPACPALSAQRVRTQVSSAASAPAVLQHGYIRDYNGFPQSKV